MWHAAIVAYFSVEPRDLSFLHLLCDISAAGSVTELEASSLIWKFDQSGDTVVVHTDDGTVEGRQVIVAPQLASRSQDEAPLPASPDQNMQRTPLGSVIKCHAVYPHAFARSQLQWAFNGQLSAKARSTPLIHKLLGWMGSEMPGGSSPRIGIAGLVAPRSGKISGVVACSRVHMV